MRHTNVTCDFCGEQRPESANYIAEIVCTVIGTTVARKFPENKKFDACGKCQVKLAAVFEGRESKNYVWSSAEDTAVN